MYRIARNCYVDLVRHPARQHAPLSRTPEALDLAARVRTTTAVYQRADVKQELARLRESLSEDDRALLVLRVDRGLSGRAVAHLLDDSEAALRKRFERVKARLRELARAAKLGG